MAAPIAVYGPTLNGDTISYTEDRLTTLNDLPKEVIINHILPFIGGVRSERSKEFRITQLQSRLMYCMRVADDTIQSWYTNINYRVGGPGQMIIRDYNMMNGHEHRYWTDWWYVFKHKVDTVIMDKGRTKYKAADLNFTTSEWLKNWVEIDKISMVDFSLVTMEVWLLYAELYRPKLLVDQN